LKSIADSGVKNLPLLAPAGIQSRLKCAAQCVKLKFDPDRGRHLVAAEEIPAGELHN